MAGPRAHVDRRRFVVGATSAAVCLAALATWSSRKDHSRRAPLLGFLWSNPRSAVTDLERAAFLAGLAEYGYREPDDVTVVWRYPESQTGTDLPSIARELVALGVDLIVTIGTPTVQAVQQLGSDVPIVMGSIGDPVRAGVVDSLRRPGRNTTGLSNFAPALSGKRLELLQQISPELRYVAYVHQLDNPTNLANLADLEQAAEPLRLRVLPVGIRTTDDLEPSLLAAIAEGAGAFIVPGTGSIPQTLVHERVIDVATRYRVLSLGFGNGLPDAGGLLAYGASPVASVRRSAYYVDRILKGVPAADLPVEQPTVFELTINLVAARALGVTIPEHVLLQATSLIG